MTRQWDVIAAGAGSAGAALVLTSPSGGMRPIAAGAWRSLTWINDPADGIPETLPIAEFPKWSARHAGTALQCR